MPQPATKSFNLPWNQHDHYWVTLYPSGGRFSPQVLSLLQNLGMQIVSGQGAAIQTGRDWKTTWDKLYSELKRLNALYEIEAVITPGKDTPGGHLPADRKQPSVIQTLADSLWLGEALLENRIMCYLQPVLDSRDKVFGYESFARVQAPDGSIIAGDKIVAASKALGIEYVIDRHLQVQAIKTFISSQFDGFLFVNFFPGFIHRPSVYLEGLSETVRQYGIIAKHIVLDFTKSETPRDLVHLKSVCEYGRSKGYSVALDDIGTMDSARKLVPEIRPDFVKVDMHLVHKAVSPDAGDTIRRIVEVAHSNGSTVIGEGVESAEIHQALKSLGVDLFQGYLFSPPVPVEAALKCSNGA